MKWSNRLIAVALCLMLILGAMPVAAFASEGDAPPAETTALTSPTEPLDPTEPVAGEPGSEFDPQMDRETMIMLALPIVVLIVGGFAAYFVFSRKKPKAAPAPQNDEDDWDYDYDPPEEDDDASDDL